MRARVSFCKRASNSSNFVNDGDILAGKFSLQAVLLLSFGPVLLPSHRAHEHLPSAVYGGVIERPEEVRLELPDLVGTGASRLALAF